MEFEGKDGIGRNFPCYAAEGCKRESGMSYVINANGASMSPLSIM